MDLSLVDSGPAARSNGNCGLCRPSTTPVVQCRDTRQPFGEQMRTLGWLARTPEAHSFCSGWFDGGDEHHRLNVQKAADHLQALRSGLSFTSFSSYPAFGTPLRWPQRRRAVHMFQVAIKASGTQNVPVEQTQWTGGRISRGCCRTRSETWPSVPALTL